MPSTLSLDQWGPGKNSNTKVGSIISTSVLIVIAIIRFPFNGFFAGIGSLWFPSPLRPASGCYSAVWNAGGGQGICLFGFETDNKTLTRQHQLKKHL